MKYQFLLDEPDFTVKSIDIQSVGRPMGYRHSFRGGRAKHGFIYVVSGRMCDTLHGDGEQTLLADAGELVFMPKGSVYTGTYALEGTEIQIVQFDLSDGRLPDWLSAPVKLALPNAKELIGAFFEPIGGRTTSHPFYHLSCLYRLLFEIDRSCRETPKKFKRLTPALDELEAYWYKNEAVSHYAALADMSEVSFRRLFREYTGMSPIEYRNDLRLSRACAILQSGEYNVSETAELCGFSNLSFFTRLYKRKYGHTPKEE